MANAQDDNKICLGSRLGSGAWGTVFLAHRVKDYGQPTIMASKVIELWDSAGGAGDNQYKRSILATVSNEIVALKRASSSPYIPSYYGY